MKQKNVMFVVPAYIESEIYMRFLEETIEGLLKQTDEGWSSLMIIHRFRESGF